MELSHSEIIEMLEKSGNLLYEDNTLLVNIPGEQPSKDLIIIRESHARDKWVIPLKIDVVYSTHPNYKENDVIYNGESLRTGSCMALTLNLGYVEAIRQLMAGPASKGYTLLSVIETEGHIDFIENLQVLHLTSKTLTDSS